MHRFITYIDLEDGTIRQDIFDVPADKVQATFALFAKAGVDRLMHYNGRITTYWHRDTRTVEGGAGWERKHTIYGVQPALVTS